jgi:Uma2 family endonuclease
MIQTTRTERTFAELYQELYRLPAHLRGEIIAGDLITSPRPALPHARANIDLSSELYLRYGRKPGGGDRPGGWWILQEPELHLETPGFTHVLSPDLAGWRRERLPELPDTAWLGLCPDWVCEILSPATARYDKREKARIYHEAGVIWRWIVDPRARTLEAFRREGAFWMLLGTWGGEDRVAVEPFDAVELEMEGWWEGVRLKE